MILFRFSSESNQKVASYLCSEIKAEFGTKYDGKTIKRMIICSYTCLALHDSSI